MAWLGFCTLSHDQTYRISRLLPHVAIIRLAESFCSDFNGLSLTLKSCKPDEALVYHCKADRWRNQTELTYLSEQQRGCADPVASLLVQRLLQPKAGHRLCISIAIVHLRNSTLV